MSAGPRPLTFGSLFAGVGGFDLGLERAGWRCAWQVENAPNRIAVLAAHWPDVPRFGDVRECGAHNLTPVDLICGGFPCTDLSVSRFGSHLGLKGAASGLVYQFGRIANELRPKWIILENVKTLKSVISEIEAIFADWELEYATLTASQFGAYTRRARTFAVGHLRDGRARKIFDLGAVAPPSFESGGQQDVLPMCLPWKGGLSLERLGACVIAGEEAHPAGV